MRALLFTICVLGAFSCGGAFRDELKSGTLYPSLGFAALAWAIGAVLTLALWRE
jgi:hypothetical protein